MWAFLRECVIPYSIQTYKCRLSSCVPQMYVMLDALADGGVYAGIPKELGIKLIAHTMIVSTVSPVAPLSHYHSDSTVSPVAPLSHYHQWHHCHTITTITSGTTVTLSQLEIKT